MLGSALRPRRRAVRKTWGRRGILIAATATLALLATGVTLLVLGLRPSGGPPQPPADMAGIRQVSPDPADPTGPAVGLPVGSGGHVWKSLPRSNPIALDIPSIGVASSRFEQLDLAPDGSLQAPADFATPGWYQPGPAPGQIGAAVIAGHVDSRRGPAVFFRLGALRPGAPVRVTRADGLVASFIVDRVARYPKDRFPAGDVYGDRSHRAELRLITCGGAFDAHTDRYLDNIVVFAHLV